MKTKLSLATDEEREMAFQRKQDARARYRRRNREKLAQKSRDRRARQRDLYAPHFLTFPGCVSVLFNV